MQHVPIDQIHPNPYQTRLNTITDQSVTDLARSIYSNREATPDTLGLLQLPIARLLIDNVTISESELLEAYGSLDTCLQREPSATIQLAMGHRRTHAFRLLARQLKPYQRMPLQIDCLTDQQMWDIAHAENNNREDVGPLEEALSYAKAIEDFGWTHAQLADHVGAARTSISNKLRLLKLDHASKQALHNGRLTEKVARHLLSIQHYPPSLYERIRWRITALPDPPQPAQELLQTWPPNAVRLMFIKNYLPDEWTECSACKEPLELQPANEIHYLSVGHLNDNPEPLPLCHRCYRWLSGWTQPSYIQATRITKAEEENICRHFSRMHYATPDANYDAEGVKQPTCTKCPYRTPTACLEPTCFQAKEEQARTDLHNDIATHTHDHYGFIPQIKLQYNYSNARFRAHDPLDAAMHQAGHCITTRCEHMILRYNEQRLDSTGLYLDETSFQWECDNTNRKRACQAKWQRDQEDGDPEAKAAAAQERKRQANHDAKKATQQLAQALLDGNPTAWVQLAGRWCGRTAEGKQQAAEILAARLLELPLYTRGIDWNKPDSLDTARARIAERLKEHGIHQPSRTLGQQFDRIAGFVETHYPDLTQEQVAGNITNLQALLAQTNGDQDLATRCRQLIAHLNRLATPSPTEIADLVTRLEATYPNIPPEDALDAYLALQDQEPNTPGRDWFYTLEIWLRANTNLLQPKPA